MTTNIKKNIETKNVDTLDFQVIDWRCHNEKGDIEATSSDEAAENETKINLDDDSESDDLDVNARKKPKPYAEQSYTIQLFGRTRDDKTVYVKVVNYIPVFYVKIPKTWRKTTIEKYINKLNDVAKTFSGGFLKHEEVVKHDFYGFTNYTSFRFLKLSFKDSDSMKKYSYIIKNGIRAYGISTEPIKLKVYESKLEPFLRCMHERKLDAFGWISIPKKKCVKLSDEISCCDINVCTEAENLNRIEDITMAPLIIASFDIECTSEDGSFPKACRDNDDIIQIGITLNRIGVADCYKKIIITLKSCDVVEGVRVIACKSEKQLLLTFTKLLREINPDIVVGFNIFGFDFKYMHDRAKKIGIYSEFCKLSRITDEKLKLTKRDLSSAALGQNTLYYFDMVGRVVIDLYKVIQRDHKLPSYKLDSCAAYFIRESIIELRRDESNNKTRIISKSAYGVNEGQYVTVTYFDGISENKHMEGKKFIITGFEKATIKEKDKKSGEYKDVVVQAIVVEGLIDSDIFGKSYDIFWSQVKDDLQPREMFELHEGSSKDRSIIAKYCIQDCVLVSKIMEKLRIVINNAGMASVCHVPLTYIFLRGQSIKIFSLVAKFCQEKNHLIPDNNYRKKDQSKAMTQDSEQLPQETDAKDEMTKSERDAAKNEKMYEKLVNHFNNKDKDDYEDDEDEDDDEESYEGAVVFIPRAGVYYEPIPVLDYVSLYPNCMINKNLSHECLVNDPTYLNLEGYDYNAISYVVSRIIETFNNKKKKISRGAIEDFREKYMKLKHEYKKNGCIIEEEKGQSHRKMMIYDVDQNKKKRYILVEVSIDLSTKVLKILKYQTSIFAEKNLKLKKMREKKVF